MWYDPSNTIEKLYTNIQRIIDKMFKKGVDKLEAVTIIHNSTSTGEEIRYVSKLIRVKLKKLVQNDIG